MRLPAAGSLLLGAVLLLVLPVLDRPVAAIKCYQCSSDSDPEGVDACGAYQPFDREKSLPIECNSEESKMPGTFCVKITKQGPRGFIWDGRWRQVIRRCASIASTGVTNVCNWGVEENGDYWQECSCSEDGCNSAPLGTRGLSIPAVLLLALLPAVVARSWTLMH